MGRDCSSTTPDVVRLPGKVGGIAEPEPEPISYARADPEPNLIAPAEQKLTGLELAARLGESGYNFTKWRKKGRGFFANQTQSLDPEGIAWSWEGPDDANQPRYIPWGDGAKK